MCRTPINTGRKLGQGFVQINFYGHVFLLIGHGGRGLLRPLRSQLKTGDDQEMTAEDRVVLALIGKAFSGDVAAVREVLDSVYGQLADTQNLNVNLQDLSDEELEQIING